MSSIDNKQQLLSLGLNFSQKLGLRTEYFYFRKQLEQLSTQ